MTGITTGRQTTALALEATATTTGGKNNEDMTQEQTRRFRGWRRAGWNTAEEEKRYAECIIGGLLEIDKEGISMKT